MAMIRFSVPRHGQSHAVAMEVAARDVARLRYTPSLANARANLDAVREIHDACQFVNMLLARGIPWAALAECRRSAGALGALIEAAHNRLAELGAPEPTLPEAGDAA